MKPCPFCGKAAELKEISGHAVVICYGMDGCRSMGPSADTAEEALRLWETRIQEETGDNVRA